VKENPVDDEAHNIQFETTQNKSRENNNTIHHHINHSILMSEIKSNFDCL
jgi:hypothetical protein